MNELIPISEELSYRLLSKNSWPDFETMFDRHSGVSGGCWCTFHLLSSTEYQNTSREQRHDLQYERMLAGTAQGLILYHGETAIGWAQFGKTQNFERLLRTRKYKAWLEEGNLAPLWFIPCLFIDKSCRRKGLQKFALKVALDAIERQGGGLTAAMPFNIPGNAKPQYNGSIALFEREGFELAANFGNQVLMLKEV